MADEQEGTLTPQGPTFELVSVTEEQKRAHWLEARRLGVGASEVAAIFGLSAYGETIQDIYDRKVGVLQENEDSPDMQRGRALESIILGLYTLSTGRAVIPARDLPNAGLVVHPNEPHMLATPDGEIVLPERPTLEVKSVRHRKFTWIKERGLSDAWILQKQAQLEAGDRPWGAYAFHAADPWAMVTFDIERDRELGEALLEKVREFWGYVERRERPVAPMSMNDLPQVQQVKGDLVIRTDAEFIEAMNVLKEVNELEKTVKQLEAAAKERVAELFGGKGFGRAEAAGVRVHHRMMDGKVSFDKKSLVAAAPLDPILASAVIFNVIPAEENDLRVRLIDTLAKNARLNLAQFEKRGEPFPQFNAYFLKQGAENDEEDARLPAPKLRLEKGKSDG